MTSPAKDQCRLCGCANRFVFAQAVLGRTVGYFDCDHCGYFQTESPTWLDEAYAEPINASDTGMLMRNAVNVGKVVATLASLHRLHGRVLDHAGGYGILVRLLRDAGVDAYWSDLYCDNILARGFEAAPGSYDLLTAFEVLEHFVDPLAQLREMLGRAPAILSTTELIVGAAAPSADWWYLGTSHGQHVGFFRARTLAFAAEALGCNIASDGRSTHLFSRAPIPAGWNTLVRHSRFWKLAKSFGLRSKTVSDSEHVVHERNERPLAAPHLPGETTTVDHSLRIQPITVPHDVNR